MAAFSDPVNKVLDKISDYGIPLTHKDMEYIEHRTYQAYVGTIDFDIRDSNHNKADSKAGWAPYEQDYTHYPEVFKRYGDNFEAYEDLKRRFENDRPGQEMAKDPRAKEAPRDMSPWEKREADLLPRFTGTSC